MKITKLDEFVTLKRNRDKIKSIYNHGMTFSATLDWIERSRYSVPVKGGVKIHWPERYDVIITDINTGYVYKVTVNTNSFTSVSRCTFKYDELVSGEAISAETGSNKFFYSVNDMRNKCDYLFDGNIRVVCVFTNMYIEYDGYIWHFFYYSLGTGAGDEQLVYGHVKHMKGLLSTAFDFSETIIWSNFPDATEKVHLDRAFNPSIDVSILPWMQYSNNPNEYNISAFMNSVYFDSADKFAFACGGH